jgi:hypothetical protein
MVKDVNGRASFYCGQKRLDLIMTSALGKEVCRAAQ